MRGGLGSGLAGTGAAGGKLGAADCTAGGCVDAEDPPTARGALPHPVIAQARHAGVASRRRLRVQAFGAGLCMLSILDLQANPRLLYT